MRKLRSQIAGLSLTAAAAGFLGLGGSGGCNNTTAGGGGGGTTGGTGGGGGATVHLSLSVTGAGKGMVTANAGDIACDKEGGSCEADLAPGTEITLTPSADAGFFFNGWREGVCSGFGPCTFTLNEDTHVSASFIMIAFSVNGALDGSDAVQVDKPQNVWTITSDGTLQTPITALTADHVGSSYPAWSPDGEKLAYRSNRNLTLTSNAATPNSRSNIWISNADGSGGDRALTHLTNGLGSTEHPIWSPDGTRIAYSSNRNPDLVSVSTNFTSNIFIVNADGSGGDVAVTHLKGPSNSANSPAWSPDGTRIVYQSTRSLDASDLTTANPTNNIWVSNADGSGDDQALTQNPGTAYNFSPQWSPDGSQIVFVSYMDPANPSGPALSTSNIWIVNADGTGLGNLTANTSSNSYSSEPFWSPDGKAIVFYSRMNLSGVPTDPANGSANIWIIEPNGEGLRHLTSYGIVYTIAPFWAPDGSLILFDSSGLLDGSDAYANVQNLWKITPDGSSQQPVTHYTAPGIFEFNPVNYD